MIKSVGHLCPNPISNARSLSIERVWVWIVTGRYLYKANPKQTKIESGPQK